MRTEKVFSCSSSHVLYTAQPLSSPPLPSPFPPLPLPQGADLTLPDFSGVSPFLLAVQENATQCVAVAMNYCPKEMLESVDEEGRSPLLYAIHSGSVEVCRQLLELGASAETPDQVKMGERDGVRVGGGGLHMYVCMYG